ncbi:DUF3667 domain-containing protein [Lysobacter sp. A6]|uniref:DUF3667 domain-containing protein n=1 Tax=Noviluteimonas lactosilytica TaxID=2888523 RepID=A0ABS8JI01_9GAMM|nr:DUF3667 domain-containing protein [Lysobacter lactosilyticus]
MNDEAPAWTCPTCHRAVVSEYCPGCGERRLRPRDLTLRGLLAQMAQSITNLDARLLRTARSIVRHPGELTVRYLQGPRKPYIGPIAFFLLANVLFVAMEALTDSNVFATHLASHLRTQPWSGWIAPFVADRVAELHTTMEAFAPKFDKAVAEHAKSLVALMVLPFALVAALVYRGARRPFVAHVAYSLHFHAFMLLSLCVLLGVLAVDVWFGGAGLASRVFDNALALVHLVVCGLWLYLASGPVYGARGARRVVRALAMAFGAMLTFLGYRFVLLWITLYAT